MAKEFPDVNPHILRWARERAGYSIADVADKLSVSLGRVEGWERGDIALTFGRLDALANLYKRPSILFYLPKPPDEREVPLADFRSHQETTPDLRYQLRRANERRAVALDLYAELGDKPPDFGFRCSSDEDAAEAGARLRSVLRVRLEEQRAWAADTQGFRALNAWKDAVERAGVLVTQASKRKLGGCRGVSLFAAPISVVVLSTEATRGRIFTLMHELAHLGLRQGGLCDLHDTGVESFCNRVAAAALMPAEALRNEPLVAPSRRQGWPTDSLRRLARTFSVSEPALVLRLVTLGLAPESLYKAKVAEYRRQAEAAQASAENAPVPQHTQAIAANGRTFTRLVLDAYHRGSLTAHRAATYLDTSFKWVPDIERDIVRAMARVT